MHLLSDRSFIFNSNVTERKNHQNVMSDIFLCNLNQKQMYLYIYAKIEYQYQFSK